MHALRHGAKMSTKVVENVCSPMHENDRDVKAVAQQNIQFVSAFREFRCQ